MTVIYIDVLLLVNAIINYFLILGACFFTKETVMRKKFIIAALVGSLFSLCVLLPKVNIFISLLLKFAGSVTISFLAFGTKSIRSFVRNTVALFLTSALFAGFIGALSENANASNLLVKNFGVYVQIKPLMLVILALVIYLILCAYELLFKKPSNISKKLYCEIEINQMCARAQLLVDSGKSLKEPLSGKEVVILKKNYAKTLLSSNQLKALEAFEAKKIRSDSITECGAFSVVPFKTINGEGLILAFKASRCTLINAKKRKHEIKEPYIGFVSEKKLPDCDGIIGTDFLED